MADDPDFSLPLGAWFTVEGVIKPDRSTTATGAILAKRSKLNTAAGIGWALTVGSFRGFNHNVRFSVSDGTKVVELFSDRDLGDGIFHHIAGVIDRRQGPPAATLVLLNADGAEVARQKVDPLDSWRVRSLFALASAGSRWGNVLTDAQYVGLVDEVRISKIARTLCLILFAAWLKQHPGVEIIARPRRRLRGRMAARSTCRDPGGRPVSRLEEQWGGTRTGSGAQADPPQGRGRGG